MFIGPLSFTRISPVDSRLTIPVPTPYYVDEGRISLGLTETESEKPTCFTGSGCLPRGIQNE